MKWTLKICRVYGVDVRVHLTFALLIGWVAFIYWRQSQTITASVTGVLFILAVFLCVVLHEFGHALAARRYGIKTRDIILLPIGGVARLERMPTYPLHELWVALAGPAVNIVIAGVLFICLMLTASLDSVKLLTLGSGTFIERLMIVNIFMVGFNMIPAFPMDGGRVLRAVLATRKDYAWATQTAASIGQGIAILFGIFGLLYNPFLLFIALFIWFGASQEAGMARMTSVLGGIPVQHAMVTDFKTLNENDSLDRAVELTLAGSQKDFPVVDDGRIKGILTQDDLVKALSARKHHPTVSSAMQQNIITVESLDMLESAFGKLKSCNCRTLPVTLNRRRLVGLLTMDNLGEFLRIRAASTG